MNPGIADVPTSERIRAAHAFARTGPDELLVHYQSLGAWLHHRADRHPDAPFLKYFDDEAGESQAYSCRQFAAEVDRAAGFLASCDLESGDCFATLSYNHPMGAVLLFAAWKLGLVIAPQNIAEDDARIAFILRDAGVKLLIVHPALMARAVHLAGDAGGVQRLASFADVQESEAIAPAVAQDFRRHPALIVYTSGTTGQPKGVVLT